jgi:hypothetical protein
MDTCDNHWAHYDGTPWGVFFSSSLPLSLSLSVNLQITSNENVLPYKNN